MATTECDNCGGEINRTPAQIRRYGAGGAYCSVDCQSEDSVTRGYVDIDCENCGGSFEVPESQESQVHFCSEECESKAGVECPKCGRGDFKNEQGVKMHYTRVHGERYDKVRIEEEYGVPLEWLLPRMHHTLGYSVLEMSEILGVGRRWINDRLDEMGGGHRSPQEAAEVRLWASNEEFSDSIRRSLGSGSWSEKSRAIREEVGECELCGVAQEDVSKLDSHHIVPVLAGGTNERENILVLCPSCHRSAEEFTSEYVSPVLLD